MVAIKKDQRKVTESARGSRRKVSLREGGEKIRGDGYAACCRPKISAAGKKKTSREKNGGFKERSVGNSQEQPTEKKQTSGWRGKKESPQPEKRGIRRKRERNASGGD